MVVIYEVYTCLRVRIDRAWMGHSVRMTATVTSNRAHIFLGRSYGLLAGLDMVKVHLNLILKQPGIVLK